MFGAGAAGGGVGGGGGANGFYPETYSAQQQHRHGMDDNNGGSGGGLFCSGFPALVASEPQHIRLQSPPLHRLNHRNRNIHQQQYENTAGTHILINTYCCVYRHLTVELALLSHVDGTRRVG